MVDDTIRFQPGAPTPGGADININLNVVLVRLFRISPSPQVPVLTQN